MTASGLAGHVSVGVEVGVGVDVDVGVGAVVGAVDVSAGGAAHSDVATTKAAVRAAATPALTATHARRCRGTAPSRGRRKRLLDREGLLQHLDQPSRVQREAARVDIKGLATDEWGEAGWQLADLRQPSPVHKDRDNPHVPRQRGLDLAADEVVGPVEAAASVLIGHRGPAFSDQRQEDVARRDGSGDGRSKVVAQVDRINVLEHRTRAEMLCEPVEQPACRIRGFLPPIAYEDAAGRYCRTFHRPPRPVFGSPLSLSTPRCIRYGTFARRRGGRRHSTSSDQPICRPTRGGRRLAPDGARLSVFSNSSE